MIGRKKTKQRLSDRKPIVNMLANNVDSQRNDICSCSSRSFYANLHILQSPPSLRAEVRRLTDFLLRIPRNLPRKINRLSAFRDNNLRKPILLAWKKFLWIQMSLRHGGPHFERVLLVYSFALRGDFEARMVLV